MSMETEEVLEEIIIGEDNRKDFLKINLDKDTIRVPKNDKELGKTLDRKKALMLLKKYKIDETCLKASGLILLCLLYERGVNLNTIIRNKITEREALNILYLLERGSIVPQEIRGNLRQEPLESKLKLNTKVFGDILKKQVVRLTKPRNNIGNKMTPKTYWVHFSNGIESECLLGIKKKGSKANEKR